MFTNRSIVALLLVSCLVGVCLSTLSEDARKELQDAQRAACSACKSMIEQARTAPDLEAFRARAKRQFCFFLLSAPKITRCQQLIDKFGNNLLRESAPAEFCMALEMC